LDKFCETVIIQKKLIYKLYTLLQDVNEAFVWPMTEVTIGYMIGGSKNDVQ